MNIIAGVSVAALVSTFVYCIVGLFFFILCWKVIEKIMPFSVIKEIEEDQNTSLGIIIGSMMLGLAIIIGSVLSSPMDDSQTAVSAPEVTVKTPANPQ